MGSKRDSRSRTRSVLEWMWKQPRTVKILVAVLSFLLSLTVLKHLVKKSGHFFLASEIIHAVGIVVLIYRLTTKKSCSGLSLKTQELTALFLLVRVVCSFSLDGDIYTYVDLAALVFTAWVIFMIRVKLKSTYIKEMDNFPIYYLVVPCALLALLIHPRAFYWHFVIQILWAFCSYLEAVSVVPQLRLMQKAKMIEPFTAHYVFALGVARFLSCANWIIQVYETGGQYLFLYGYSNFWFPMALIAEIVQTFILVDFCYYYMKSFMQGQLLMRMPV